MENVGNQEERVSGFVAIVGRPNVGKSTLLNRLLGERLAITTPKPQTTRNQIRGILNRPSAQVIFVDTPGIPTKKLPEKKMAFQDYLISEALESLDGVDVVLFVLDAREGFGAEDEAIWQMLREKSGLIPKILMVLNKVDALKNKQTLLPLTERVLAKTQIASIQSISAANGMGVDELLSHIVHRLPKGPPLYPEDQLSNQNDRFLMAEMIREQFFLCMSEEIPYSIAVEVSSFEEKPDMIRIEATIYVERESQKGMVIGKGGKVLKQVGTATRKNAEKRFAKKIFLELFVKVLPNWSQDADKLRRLGYAVKKRTY